MRRHPQIEANELIVEIDHPQSGRLRIARHPSKFSETPTSVRHGAPVLGADTREVLAEFGYATAEISDLETAGAAIQAAVKPTKTESAA